MRKSIYKRFALAALLAIGCTQVANAQVGNTPKRYTMSDGKNNVQVIETSEGVNVHQIDEHCAMTTFDLKPKKNIKAGATTHTLSVYPPVDAEGSFVMSWFVAVAKGDDYLNQTAFYMGDGFIDEVEEGVYDIVVFGEALVDNYSSYIAFTITYDQVEINDDATIQSSFDDCPYSVEVYSHTPDGTPISELDCINVDIESNFNWLGKGVLSTSSVIWDTIYCENNPYLRYSAFDERSSVGFTERIYTENQTCYFIDYEPVVGCSGNIVFENSGEDLKTHEEYYYINTIDTSYYSVAYLEVMQNVDGSAGWRGQDYTYKRLVFDSSLPLTIVSNLKIEDPLDFSRGYHYTMDPKVVVSYDFNNPNHVSYDNSLTPGIMYYNVEDELVWEPLHRIYKPGGFFFYSETYPDFLTPTPMAYYNESGEKLFFGCERTPMIYQQTMAYNAETSPYGMNQFGAYITMMGENGIQRECDHDALIHISLDGEEVYCDSLCNYLANNYIPIEQSGIITVDINDNHLVVEGVAKPTTLHTELDLSRDDAMPPTMTILQVKNQYGLEKVELVDWANAQIIFAAGDFDLYQGEDWSFIMPYKAKPNVDVYYSIEGGEWLPLEYTENEELFHVNYGNVFTIGLNQLETNVADKWVNLKFVVTDEAGNSQTQELSNVFYAGEMESVNEHTVNRLQHEVYPNPFNGEVRITSSEAVNGNATFNVYNVLGAQVYHQTLNCANTTEFVWDGSQVPSGIYFYSISTENGVLQGKIVKE